MRHLRNLFLLITGLASLSLFGAISETLNKSISSNIVQEQDSLRSKKTSNDSFINKLKSKTDRHNAYNPIEKIFLHCDKNIFSAGETIWYSVYVVIGPSHQYTNDSKVVHVDLIGPDGEIVISQTHALVSGKGSGSLEIPKNLLEGSYQLRSYTQWMRNFDTAFFFTKALNILNMQNKQNVSEAVDNKIDLQFFPEGGHIIANITGKISFKAIGSDGLPKKVSGKILTSTGRTIATLRTFDRGAGFFQLTPKKDEKYFAELDNGYQYSLPEMLDDGYVMTANNRNQKSISVTVQASQSLRDLPFYILGYMRQQNYFHRKFEFDGEQTLKFDIPKGDIPRGILTLTLLGASKKPWCERPIFINNEEELVINAKIHSNKFVKRGKITLEINVKDNEGKPIATNLSIAATDMSQTKKGQGLKSILSHFLLESEIKGNVSKPGLLFRNQKIKTIQQLDLVMLTHGWRKYHWPEIWKDVKPTKEFEFAEGLSVSGKAFNTNKKPMPNATLNVIAKSGEKLGMFLAKTDLEGRFSIPDFNFSGKVEVVFNAYNYKDKPLNLRLSLDRKKAQLPKAQFKTSLLKHSKETEDYGTQSLARRRMEVLSETKGVTKLDEVVVTEKKNQKSRNQTPSALGMEPDDTLYTEDHIAMQTVLQLLSLFVGVSVNGNIVSIRNRGTPLFVLDGIPVSNGNSRPKASVGLAAYTAAGPVPTQVATMDTFTVERVEILKGPRAAMWGSRGANGVILIYTKRGEGQKYNPIISPSFTIAGHAVKKEFYSPKYDIKLDKHNIPDYRATLYWNPSLSTDKRETQQLSFIILMLQKEFKYR